MSNRDPSDLVGRCIELLEGILQRGGEGPLLECWLDMAERVLSLAIDPDATARLRNAIQSARGRASLRPDKTARRVPASGYRPPSPLTRRSRRGRPASPSSRSHAPVAPRPGRNGKV